MCRKDLGSKPRWAVVSLQSSIPFLPSLPFAPHTWRWQMTVVLAVRTYPFQLIPPPPLPLPASSPPFSDQAQWMFHKDKDYGGFIVGFHQVTVKTQFTLHLDLWKWSLHSEGHQEAHCSSCVLTSKFLLIRDVSWNIVLSFLKAMSYFNQF